MIGVMADGWRILDLTGLRGSLGVDRGGVVIFDGEDRIDRVPAADIAVVLVGTGVQFSSGVLHRLAEHDVVMMLADWRGLPQAVTHPWSSHSRIGERQVSQAGVDDDRQDAFWTQIVTAKIAGQAATLGTRKPRLAKKLWALTEQVETGDRGGVEAVAAQFYLRKMWGKDFVRDHDGGDRLNALLNYGYGILRGQGVRAVLAAGLVPALGIRHSHRSNPFNLVADLMEPFRPAVDFAVAGLPPRATLSQVETKKILVEVMDRPFDGSGVSVSAQLRDLAGKYGRYVQGECDVPTVPRWVPGTVERSVGAVR